MKCIHTGLHKPECSCTACIVEVLTHRIASNMRKEQDNERRNDRDSG